MNEAESFAEPDGAPWGPDEVLAEFNGDARAAIAALLHDLDTLARDAARATSRGYTRGFFFKLRPAPAPRGER
jgi:hypothetical protein